MPPVTPGAHCLGIGCDHDTVRADLGRDEGAPATSPRPPRRSPSRRAGRNDERRAARRALMLDAIRAA